MGKDTKIEWTHHSKSPWWGCTHAGSLGCDHCYVRDMDKRFCGAGHFDGNPRRTFGRRYWRELRRWDRVAAKLGERHRVFIGSVCDVFEEGPLQDAERAKLWPRLAECTHLDMLMLTKRPQNAARMVPAEWMRGGWPRNVWAGASVEHPDVLERRAEPLCQLPAPYRFVSAEPLLGEVTLLGYLPGGAENRPAERSINWVIAGGESGLLARPTDPAWVLWMRDQCAQRSVAFFFKQWGRLLPSSHAWQQTISGPLRWGENRWGATTAEALRRGRGTTRTHGTLYYGVGKKQAGAYLGGYRYVQLPTDETLDKTL